MKATITASEVHEVTEIFRQIIELEAQGGKKTAAIVRKYSGPENLDAETKREMLELAAVCKMREIAGARIKKSVVEAFPCSTLPV